MGSEEVGSGFDTYLFAKPATTIHPNGEIMEFCYYTVECYTAMVIDSFIFDRDDSFYRQISNSGLDAAIRSLVDSVIKDVYDTNDDYPITVYQHMDNHRESTVNALRSTFYAMVTGFLMYLPQLILQAHNRYRSYIDYRMTTHGDTIILRLMTRRNNV